MRKKLEEACNNGSKVFLELKSGSMYVGRIINVGDSFIDISGVHREYPHGDMKGQATSLMIAISEIAAVGIYAGTETQKKIIVES